ncbi:hypothetical protein BKA59DRAFT_400639 [Fusarium tricinctum]|uniref:Zn(2)-C6 fungal-type domain-containing protein n=1 Tax=Fusarium tricinctum TaxID=61284 RepID=A0A8K0RW76_9HYPO|nr:hypothetical protein BKA59DRAFT_400639 [Fusarium tricinctum]
MRPGKSPVAGSSQPITSRLRRKKATACQRCRERKQRCEYQDRAICRNCRSAKADCIPASQNRTDTYSVSYVNGLEQQVAGLLGRVSQHSSGSTVPGQPNSDGPLAQNTQPNDYTESPSFIDSLEGLYTPAVSALGNTSFDFLSYQDENLFSITQQTSSHFDNPADSVGYSGDTMIHSAGAEIADITVSEGASFFQTYFEVIHPRYPFLDPEECSAAYLKWKMDEIATGGDQVWPTRLLKLVFDERVQIFANGAILQHVRLDHKVHRHYQELALQQQNITMHSTFRPLARLQAMLLHAFYALHGENTEQVVHDVGIAMRFAILHGFHLLTSDGTHETDIKIKTWWSIYCLDKVIAITLRIPPYPPDESVKTSAFQAKPEPQCFMPWAADAVGASAGMLYNFDLRYFAHMCKIRRIHSDILNMMRRLPSDLMVQHLPKLRTEIVRWARRHASPLGVVYVAHMTRVVLYSSVPIETTPEITDELLQACCDACATFRVLQKRKHLPKHWFDVGVTIIYIVWRQATPISKSVHCAVRDCTAILAIFADRSQYADIYRDCMDILAISVLSASSCGSIDAESRQELTALVGQVEENILAPHVHTQLSQICKGSASIAS